MTEQDSVATNLRHGGLFDDAFSANLLLSLPVTNFENLSTFGEVTAKKA